MYLNRAVLEMASQEYMHNHKTIHMDKDRLCDQAHEKLSEILSCMRRMTIIIIEQAQGSVSFKFLSLVKMRIEDC